MQVEIEEISALEILDSRGNPTIEAQIVLSDGSRSRAAVPSGASTGIMEAVELRDQQEDRYLGKGVLHAVNNVNTEISDALKGKNPYEQNEIDQILIELDGTLDKGRLGANAILSASLGIARASAKSQRIPLYKYLKTFDTLTLPMPFFNILNGGAHANNNIDIQEFMIVPTGMPSFQESVRAGTEVYHQLKQILDQTGHSTAVGDEGGFAPNLRSNSDALRMIMDAIESAGFEPGKDISIALDVASSELRDGEEYFLKSEYLRVDASGFADYLADLAEQFPIVSIEDGMAEDDWDGWRILCDKLSSKMQLVGDDLFVTNPKILQTGIDSNIANAILVKLNQIGTVTETLETVRIAQEANYGVMISHRSGETEDSAIADLAVATSAGQIKTGAPSRSERTAKYNRLLWIENELGEEVTYSNLF